MLLAEAVGERGQGPRVVAWLSRAVKVLRTGAGRQRKVSLPIAQTVSNRANVNADRNRILS